MPELIPGGIVLLLAAIAVLTFRIQRWLSTLPPVETPITDEELDQKARQPWT